MSIYVWQYQSPNSSQLPFSPCEGNKIRVYRKSMRMAKLKWDTLVFFQQMDVGIFTFFIEMCLKHENKDFTRTLFVDKGEELKELIAEYTVNN